MKWAIRGVAALIVVAALVGAAFVWHRSTLQRGGVSQPVTADWAELGGIWLRADLDEALVIIPDRPHARHQVESSRTGGDIIGRRREFRVSTNSQRLRDDELGAKTRTRILSLGESVASGWGVDVDDSYPVQLELELERRGHDVEVINAATPNAGSTLMAAYCEKEAPALEPDLIVWNRRPLRGTYVSEVQRCARAHPQANILVVLPPVSQFDVHGAQVWERESTQIASQLGSIPLLELTPVFRAAQEGRGETLRLRGSTVEVVDQESGRVWLGGVPRPQKDLPAEIYALFESNPEVREALFFDEGHPDAEGFLVYASAVADAVEPLL